MGWNIMIALLSLAWIIAGIVKNDMEIGTIGLMFLFIDFDLVVIKIIFKNKKE